MLLIYYILYILLSAVAIASLMIFRPFPYVDNNQSYIQCFTDGIGYETSPNLIFALDTKLDSFNDSKARKLCAYHIISDYINMYQTPKEQNYMFLPAKLQDSSWLNAVFVGFVVFALGFLCIERIWKWNLFLIFLHDMKKLSYLIFPIVIMAFGFLLYFLLMRHPAAKLYCQRQVDYKLHNFRQSVRRNGAPENIEENTAVKKFLKSLYDDCLKHEISRNYLYAIK